MAQSKKDSDIELCSKAFETPLILVPDTRIQRVPPFRGIDYPPPCRISEVNFQILRDGVFTLAVSAGFDFTGHPGYHVFNDLRFMKHRRSFWQPILRTGYPIYIVSSMFGVIWPGDRIGPYDLGMEESFIYWKQNQLWRVILEFYDRCDCDCVISYLPNLYDNIVRIEDTPWYIFEPYDIIDHMPFLLKIARNSQYNSETQDTEYNTIPAG